MLYWAEMYTLENTFETPVWIIILQLTPFQSTQCFLLLFGVFFIKVLHKGVLPLVEAAVASFCQFP